MLYLLMMQKSSEEVVCIQATTVADADTLARARSKKLDKPVAAYEIPQSIPHIQTIRPECVEDHIKFGSWDTCSLGFLIQQRVYVTTPYKTWGL